MMKRIKENKGITLIALVITIIVLLILAGVAISMLSGEHGILNQAAKAKTETERKSTEEAVRLATIAAMTNTNHKVNVDELKKELTNSLGSDYTIGGDETNGWTVKVNGEIYTIASDGDINEPVQSIPVEDYGAVVTNYTLSGITTDVKWKIFLEDGQNIYLIADNCIEPNNIPLSKGGHELTNGDFNDTVLNDYSGASDIVENEKLQKKYNQWAYEHTSEPSSEYKSIKAVAYMLDTNIWNKYVNSDYAEYAVGGPTIELFCESYKKTHNSSYVEYNKDHDSGYSVKLSNKEEPDLYKFEIYLPSDETPYKDLYISKNKEWTMASPAAIYEDGHPWSYNSLIFLDSSGRIYVKPYRL